MSNEAKFSDEQVGTLRAHYNAIERVDVNSEVWLGLVEFIRGLPDAQVHQLAQADIKWVSYLAAREGGKRGLKV